MNGVDFSVTGGREAHGKRIVLSVFIDEDNSWSSIRLSYFITSSDDFITGIYVINAFHSSNSAGNPSGILKSEFYFPRWKIKAQQDYRISTFLSGVRSQDSQPQIRILGSAIDAGRGKLLVQIWAIGKPII